METPLSVPSPMRLHVTDEVVAAYGRVADDHNPIHFDDDAARAVGMPGRIAHGMISGALLLRLLQDGLGTDWDHRGVVELVFIRPLPVGATVTAHAASREDGRLEVWVESDEPGHPRIIVGTAWLAADELSATQ